MLELQEHDQLAIKNPFPGLRPFDTDESLIFFGRDGLSDTLLEKLRATRFVAVVGTSGSGKSSLVKAGLLPALAGGFMRDAGSHWRIALFRPINNPIGNLSQALSEARLFLPSQAGLPPPERRQIIESLLRHSSLGLLEVVRQARMESYENLLIVVDQFEELYRFEPSPEVEHPKQEASAFVKLLLEASQQIDLPIYVILTMRSDYLGESAHFWGLPEAINRGQFLIPRMDDDEKREAIEGPIRVFKDKISSPLVNRLLNDVGDDPGQLPILQHALMRTWDYRLQHPDGSAALGIGHYENPEVGGMARALSLHADEAYGELNADQRVIAERMFKRLTEKGVGIREGRLPATVGEICEILDASEAEVIAVIEVFRKEGRSFLMPPVQLDLTADTLIDISHESLIRGWERLKTWVDEEADSAKIYLRLVDSALGYPSGTSLLTNPALQIALNWRVKRKPNEAWARRYLTEFGKALLGANRPVRPTWANSDDTEFGIATRYLDLSKNEHDRIEARQERQRRKYLVIVSAAALLLFILLIIASVSWGITRRERQHAEAERVAADKLRLSADTETAKAKIAERVARDAQAQAYEDRQRALIAEQAAIDRQKELEGLRIQAVAAQVRSEVQANRGNLLEEGISAALSGDLITAIGKLENVGRIYNKSRERSKEALNEILIGSTILRSEDSFDNNDLDSSTALPHFKNALTIASSESVKLKGSAFVGIGDQIRESSLDSKEAIPYYEYALGLFNEKDIELRVDTLTKLGGTYLESGEHLDTGVEKYNEAINLLDQKDPKKINIYLGLGDAYLSLNRLQAAEGAYNNAATLAKASGKSVALGDSFARIAEAYFSSDKSRALNFYTQAHVAYGTKDPGTSPDALMGDAMALEGIGRVYESRKDTEQALQYYDQALSNYQISKRNQAEPAKRQAAIIAVERLTFRIKAVTHPPAPLISEVLSKTIQEKGIASAVSQYQDLKRNHANEYDFREELLNSLGYSLIRSEKVKDAIEIFKLNVAAYPNAANTYDSLADAYAAAGNKELAIANYEKAIMINPAGQRTIEKLRKIRE